MMRSGSIRRRRRRWRLWLGALLRGGGGPGVRWGGRGGGARPRSGGGGEALRPLSEMEVRGLVNGDARALLGTAVRFMLDERVRDRIIAETRGNPLALLELPRGLTASELAVGFGRVDSQELSGRIEASF